MRPVSRRIRPAYRRTTIAAVMVLITGVVATPAQAAGNGPTTPPAVQDAPGGPGAMSHFDLARKDCLGTARNSTSKVWFTVANGVLSDVYYPTIDNTNNETLQFVVTDGTTFTDLQTRDMTYQVRALDDSGMSCRVTSTARNGLYTLTTDYFTDPRRDSVVMQHPTQGVQGQRATISSTPGSTARSTAMAVAAPETTTNGGADDAVIDTSTGSPVPVSIDTVTATNAANRDYATPVYAALRADRPFLAASSGFAGTASDGLTQLDADHRLATTYANAPKGNVVQTAQLDVHGGRSATLALGFGSTQAAAVATAGATAGADAGKTLRRLSAWLEGVRQAAAPAGERARVCPARQRKAARPDLLLVRERAEGQRGQDLPGRRRRVAGQPVGAGGRRGRPDTTPTSAPTARFSRATCTRRSPG